MTDQQLKLVDGDETVIENTELETLRAELIDARVDAADSAGRLRDALAERDRAEASRDEAREYAGWLNLRGNQYRARALALMAQARNQRDWSRRWNAIAQRTQGELSAAESALAAERAAHAATRALLERSERYAWHDTAVCLGDLDNHPCICNYQNWRAEVAALLAAQPAAGQDAKEARK